MTITTQKNRKQHEYYASIEQYPFDFPVLQADHLVVYEGVSLDQKTTASYEVFGLGEPEGGYITFSGMQKPQEAALLTLVREVPATQEVDYRPYDAFPAETHEGALDKLTMLIQQHDETLDRVLKAPITSPGEEFDLTVPPVVVNGIWMYDETGTLVAIDLIAALAELAGESGARHRDYFSANMGQTEFECSFRIQNEAVYYNGAMIPKSAYTITDKEGGTVESVLNLNEGCEYAGDIIEVVGFTSVTSMLLGSYLPTIGGTLTGGLRMDADNAITFGPTGLSGIQRDVANIFKIVNADANPIQFGVNNEVVKQLNADRSFSDWLLDAEVADTYREIKWLSVNTTTKVFNVEVNGVAATISYT